MAVTNILLLVLINVIFCSGKCIDHRTQENFFETLLRNHIKGIITNEAPRSKDNCSIVDIEVLVVVLNMKYDSDGGKMTIYSKVIYAWRDDRIDWDPKQYGDVTETYINGRKMWTPEFTFQDTEYQQRHYRYCKVHRKLIVCSDRFVFEVRCILEGSEWPYDRQKCVLVIAAERNSPVILRYRKDMPSILDSASQVGGGYDLIGMTVKNIVSPNSVSIEFLIERRSSCMSVFIVFPCIALMLLTLSSSLLDFLNSNRLFVICFSLFCHLYFLTILGSFIPYRSLKPPKMLLFFRGSVILTALNAFCVFVFVVLMNSACELPPRLVVLCKYIYKGPLGYILPVIYDNVKWLHIAYILNLCLIMITAIVYMTMYLVLVPSAYEPFKNITTYTFLET